MNRPFVIDRDIHSDGIRLRTVRYAPGVVQPPHEHASATATLIVRGGLVERVGAREEAAGPLSVVVKPAGVRHANRFGPHGASAIQIGFESNGLGDGDEEWHLGEWRWIHGGDASRPFLALLASLRRAPADPPGGDEIESLVYDVRASLSQGGAAAHSRSGRAGSPPGWLARTHARLAEDPGESLRVRDLAREAGVHPVSLARAYRRHYGVSVTAAMRRRRMALAAARLGDGDEALCEVALGAGFADQAHLCRSFKGATGLTPLRYRRLARA